jgi:hypothetical protein
MCFPSCGKVIYELAYYVSEACICNELVDCPLKGWGAVAQSEG